VETAAHPWDVVVLGELLQGGVEVINTLAVRLHRHLARLLALALGHFLIMPLLRGRAPVRGLWRWR